MALLLSGLSAAALAKLLRSLGSPEAVLQAPRMALLKLLPEKTIRRLREPDQQLLDQTMRWLAEDGHQMITWEDADYPKGVLELSDAPPVLFYLGDRSLLQRPSLAIVGSRNASPQGKDNARAFAQTLSEANITVISGLASGIDSAAHEGGLSGAGSTIAVIGTGLDRVYPPENRKLAHRIAERGGLLSEFIPGTPPLRENFPRRNRIISGMAQGVLVVEATLSSGSLITARLAAEQGRDVFAIPGSIHSPFSKGCHKLIREGAKLVETAYDILDELPTLRLAAQQQAAKAKPEFGLVVAKDPPPEKPLPEEVKATTSEEGFAAELLKAMGYDPVDLDTLADRTGRPVEELLATLSVLEMDGKVVAMPGGKWVSGIR